MKKKALNKGSRHEKEHSQYRWAATVFILAVILSAGLSLASQAAVSEAELFSALLILFIFIAIGILFDIIGVAVTAADERPFHSMASHREKGAKEALRLLKNAEHVSSICNDVVGDICGIVSGTMAAVIVLRLQALLPVNPVFLSVGITALISGLTIGGKALGKKFAIRKSTRVVYLAGRFLHIFHR